MCDDLGLMARIGQAARATCARPALGWAIVGVLGRMTGALDAVARPPRGRPGRTPL